MSIETVDHWKARALQAEEAMRAARRAVALTRTRRAILAALGGLRTGETITTADVRNATRLSSAATYEALRLLALVGMVSRHPPATQGRGAATRWALGYMVHPEDDSP